MKITRYINTSDMTIEFQDKYKYKTDTTYQNFKVGKIWNPYDKTVCNVGYVGEGKYKTGTAKNKDFRYRIWQNIIYRCYSEKHRYSHPAYDGCTMCEEWHNFQNFAKWYDDNYYQVGNEKMHIDKDVLIKDNKLYSPDTCIIIPQRINMIFMKKTKKRDSDLPNAIYRCVKGYKAAYNGKSLGVFKTLEEAIYAHDYEMKLNILQVAEEYKDKLPLYIYNALIKWDLYIAA